MKGKVARNVILVFIILSAMSILLACGGSKEEPTPVPTVEEQAPAEAPIPAGDSEKGQLVYTNTCTACHGPEGEGVEGLGKDMTTSEFIAELSDAEMLEFLKKGRDPGDPLNTTGVLMPPKGGNPALSDEQLLDVIAFMRSIQK